MSLQVWLPLQGDFHNQGLFNKLPTANTQTATNIFSQTGKIGASCLSYSENLTTYFYDTTNNEMISLFGPGKKYSFACWLKLKGYGSSSILFQIGYNDTTTYPSGYRNFGLWWTNATSGSGSPRFVINNGDNGVGGSVPTSIATDYENWHHFAYSFDNTNEAAIKTVVYIDGQQVASKTFNHTSNSDNNQLNTANTNNYINLRPAVASYNDLRIYDHILSPKEVEEIAKGLVLHYKLDRSLNMAPTTYNYQGWTIGSGWTINGNVASFSRTGATANNWVRLIPPLRINPNDYPNGITVSMDLLTPDVSAINSTRIGALQICKANGTRIGWVEPNWNLSSVVNNKWTRISYTFSQNNLKNISDGTSSASDVSYTMFSFQLVQNGNISIKNIQIEPGNKATGYKPADEGTTIYDSSGYSHNGTIVGSLTAAAGSPRYDCATISAGGDNNGISLNRDLGIAADNKFSFSCWAKLTQRAASGMIWSVALNDNLQFNFGTMSGGLAEQFFTFYNGTKYTDCAPGNLFNDTSWHHYVGTWDNQIAKLYKDGVLHTSSTVQTSYATTIPYTNAQGRKILFRKYNGFISDARIYATVLTAEQVKELYNTSMSIDSSGNIHARELVEL